MADYRINIAEFYENKEIFITGGSGFMGKFLIEKLLRSCPKLKTIYILLRSKKGKSIEERSNEIFDSLLFEKLKSAYPENIQKVKPINGDISEIGLGISEDDIKRLSDVSIVFHAAASVRFDDPVKDAIIMNTRGTYEMIKFAKKLKNIEVFVHVSTAYCNPDKHHIEEKVYPPYMNWRDAIKIAENFEHDSLEPINAKLRCMLPNTYTFTKNLSESIIEEFKNEIPFIIFRPSVVNACLNDPLPGWIENFNGPVANLIACGYGILRTVHMEPSIQQDLIPVDFATRAMIIACYKKGISKDSYMFDVYNASMKNYVKINGEIIIELCKELIKENPLENTVYAPGGTMTRYYFWHLFRYILFQLSVAILLDTVLKYTGKRKPILMKLQRKLILGTEAIRHFFETPYFFDNVKYCSLEKLIPSEEYEDFTFLKYKNYNLKNFYRQNLIGAKLALLKDPPQATDAARRRFNLLVNFHRVYCAILYLLAFKFIVLPTFSLIKSYLY